MVEEETLERKRYLCKWEITTERRANFLSRVEKKTIGCLPACFPVSEMNPSTRSTSRLISHIDFVHPSVPDDSRSQIASNYEARQSKNSSLIILKPKHNNGNRSSDTSKHNQLPGTPISEQDVENYFVPPPKVLYPRHRLQSLLEWGVLQTSRVGLINQGHTCFMDASLQCLYHTPPFTQFILKSDHSKQCLQLSNAISFTLLTNQYLRQKTIILYVL